MTRDLQDSYIELVMNALTQFAKLSKILAETFQDIHKICLNEMSNLTKENKYQNQSKSTIKQLWTEKKEDKNKNMVGEQDQPNQQSQEDQIKPIKTKKNKVKVCDNHQNNNEHKQKKHEKKKKTAKWEQEGKPRPPLNAFMLFLRYSKFQIMEAKPQLTPSQVSSYASSLWNELSEEDKEKYRSEYRENRAKYDEQLKQYNQKQRLFGKTPIKNKKQEVQEKNGKDILDHEVLEVDDSNNSDSFSGI